MFPQMAKKKGARIVKDVWEESDDFGTVRFATVQTVRVVFSYLL